MTASLSTSAKTPPEQIVAAMRQLVDTGLTSGASGNVSVRTAGGMLITPTGIAPAALDTSNIVALGLDGAMTPGQLHPSSEWRIHADIYRAKPGVNAVVHCHSPYATILACAHRTIPAQHYMIAAAGCDEIPLAPYETFGTAALSEAALAALDKARACLLANHGQVATGATLEEALKLAALVEELAHWHWGALAIGGPLVLSDQQMAEVRDAFADYGQQDRQD
jgi:L-fuculose-phosphate aldolase